MSTQNHAPDPKTGTEVAMAQQEMAPALQIILQARNRNRTSSPLLRLPRELRDHILIYVVDGYPPKVMFNPKSFPATLRSSHQLRQETAELFFTRKTFICMDLGYAMALDAAHKQYFRKICMQMYSSHSRSPRDKIRTAEQSDVENGFPLGTFRINYLPWSGPTGPYYNALGESSE